MSSVRRGIRSGVVLSGLGVLFGADGPLARRLTDYRPRPGQLELAEAIAETLDDAGTLVAEAATGTGKTLAYLVPVIRSNRRVILSTGTLTLQAQLFHRDLPAVLGALEADRTVRLLKGRSNYLCLHRLELHLGRADELPEQRRGELQRVRRWARTTERGEVSELTGIPEKSPVWPLVTSTVDNCLGTDCPVYNDCHVVRARREAQEADILVVNHHLLFADLALKRTGFGEVLPGADAVVLDEAHQVPEIATRFFSASLSANQLRELVRDTRTGAGTVGGGLKALREPVDAVEQAMRSLRSAFADLPERGDWARMSHLENELQALCARLGDLAAALESPAEASRDLAQCAERVDRLRTTLDDHLQPGAGRVRWFSNRGGYFALHVTPLSVAEPFSELRRELPAAWIMTSATLAVRRDFSHFTRRLGLEEPRTLVIDSPFDYRRQARLWVLGDLPAPGAREHTGALLTHIRPLLETAGGRAFLLFTTHRALRRAADWLRTHSDFNLLVQAEAPREALLERFRDEGNSLLLGAASFWEGVDVPGRALAVVVIDKLPFATPDDPVLAATLEAAREAGDNPFLTLQLPQAVIALKQGAGRLIRQAGDAGILVLGDPRIVSKPYGRQFLGSLPEMPRVASAEEASAFIREHCP